MNSHIPQFPVSMHKKAYCGMMNRLQEWAEVPGGSAFAPDRGLMTGAPSDFHALNRREMHDSDDGAHIHELSIGEKGVPTEVIWKIDNVELTTVGIDIGSSTSHLMFARVHLQRKTQMLSSQFVVVGRKILWRSPILLTPFLPDATIDAARLQAFIEGSYKLAGLAPADIDSGAVILTGEAIKKTNARAIAELFAAESGKFVCASAGHHLECVLAANGSGAVALSRDESLDVLNVDIGGGTTKLALIKNGEILSTCAVAVGGRLLTFDAEGRLVRIDDSAQMAAKAHGIELRLGERLDAANIDKLVGALSDVVVAMVQQKPAARLAKELLLTSPLSAIVKPDVVSFSGGVSEYIYKRENAVFGDIARPLAGKVIEAFSDGRIAVPIRDPGQGIRATVIGASQFSVQVSGKTIHISEEMVLPVHNIPVLSPALALDGDFSARSVAAGIGVALARAHISEGQPTALALRWRGDPHYARLRSLADGIALALAAGPGEDAPLILMIDGDIGKTLGHILEHELHITRSIVSIDGIQLREFDYVDIGGVIEPSNVVPVVIKSLLFSTGQRHL